MPRPSSNSLARILPRQLQFHSMHSATNLLFHRPRSGLTFPSCHSRGKTNRWERPHLQKNCAFYFYLRLVPFIPRSCRHLSMYGRAVFLELIIVLILPLLRSRRPKPLISYFFFGGEDRRGHWATAARPFCFTCRGSFFCVTVLISDAALCPASKPFFWVRSFLGAATDSS